MVNLYFIKTIPLLLLTALLLACQEKEAVDQQAELKLYYLTCWYNRNSPDTVGYEGHHEISANDSLLTTEVFRYENESHEIKMYRNDYPYQDDDGGAVFFTLDSLGIFYLRSTSWPSFSRLSSNNDSINDLISTALGFVATKSSLHCYDCE